ncbi:MAG: penicillin acylase family protein [Acidobacteria bacterium]|nr:penicillin acylase family protein [Acidobacteriota bacterium]
MSRKFLLLIFALILPVFSSASSTRPADKITVYRDEYGVPHIFAPTREAGLYAQGWASAEDRLDEILKNYLRGSGEMSAAFGGEDNFRDDTQARMWRLYDVARDNYDKIMPEVRSDIEAFIEGIGDYMAAHPDQVPSWWGNRRLEKYMPVAFGRQYIWGWPAGQAFGDLRAIGVTPNFQVDMRASNQMAISPSRSKDGFAMLIIDPHLQWFGRQRFWELRLHAGEINASGFATAGVPYVGLGHSSDVAWAHTTGGPDTADVYTLQLDPANPLRYKYDGGWREIKTRKVLITVKGEEKPREVTYYDSHYGPIVAKKGNTAYAAKLAYAEDVGYIESKYLFNIAKDYKGAMKALENGRVMPQNIMVADTGGNIYYQRTGRVPIRPKGYDWTKPVDGSTSKTEWLGIHKTSDLLSILNPPQGYMQNCNVPPDVMMVNSPLQAEKFPFYMFNDRIHNTHQRGYSAVKWLEEHKKISVDEMKAFAVDMFCPQFDRWVKELTVANQKFGSGYKTDADYQAGLGQIQKWDGYANADSQGALKYYYWRNTLMGKLSRDGHNALIEKVNDYVDLFGWSKPRQAVTEAEQRALVDALADAMKRMRSTHSRIDLVYGDYFRVGRDELSWPVGGGTLIPEGMATLRSIGFGEERPDHTRWGGPSSGQSSTEVVVLSKPIRSFTQPPIGQSDRKDSPHYRDQAEKLFSPAKMKPSWFAKEELLNGHVKSQIQLDWPRKK